MRLYETERMALGSVVRNGLARMPDRRAGVSSYEIGVEMSVEKAKARGLKLPLVYMDRTEALDEVNFDGLKETAAQSGLQFFIARVTNEPELTIETE